MLLTAHACCNTYWGKHRQSNFVALLNAGETTQKNTENTVRPIKTSLQEEEENTGWVDFIRNK